MYVPNPIRCRKCFRLGHFADNCTNEQICSLCSKPDHKDLPCETFVPQCINCNGPHPSLDIKCPKFIQEKDIKTIQFREKITYFAAKKLYRESRPASTNKSYSEVIRSNRKGVEIGCQTDEYILEERNSNELIKTVNAKSSRNNTGLSPHSNSATLSTPHSPPSLPATPSPPPSPLSLPSHVPLPATPSTSADQKPLILKQGRETPEDFKTPPTPRRKKRLDRQNSKGKIGNNRKSGDEMETT